MQDTCYIYIRSMLHVAGYLHVVAGESGTFTHSVQPALGQGLPSQEIGLGL